MSRIGRVCLGSRYSEQNKFIGRELEAAIARIELLPSRGVSAIVKESGNLAVIAPSGYCGTSL